MLPVSAIVSYEIVNSNVFHLNLSEPPLDANSTITAASGFSMYYIDVICKTAPPDAKNLSGNDSVVYFDAFRVNFTQHLSWLVSGEGDRSVFVE